MAPSLKFTIEKLQQQPRRMAKRIREHGLGNYLSWCGYQLTWRMHERRLGIDTLEHAYGINVWGKDGGQWYDPIDYRCLWKILDYMSPNPEHDVFLDYGAGLGRPIIAAAMRPFKRVIGVENNELLLKLCRQHIAAVEKRGKLTCPIELVDADAATYEVPGDVTHILMHNAFVEQSLTDRVLQRIQESLEETPRNLTLVFVPLLQHQHFLENCEFLDFADELSAGFWDHARILVYRANHRATNRQHTPEDHVAV